MLDHARRNVGVDRETPSIEREQHDEVGSHRRAAARSIEMNRIRSGIGESDELAESAGRRRKRGLALPGEAYVHGVNIVIQRLEIDPMPFERPWPIDHIGQDGDAHAGRHHAANGFNRQRTEDDVGDMRRTLPVAHGRAFGLIDGEHQKRFTNKIGELNTCLVQ